MKDIKSKWTEMSETRERKIVDEDQIRNISIGVGRARNKLCEIRVKD